MFSWFAEVVFPHFSVVSPCSPWFPTCKLGVCPSFFDKFPSFHRFFPPCFPVFPGFLRVSSRPKPGLWTSEASPEAKTLLGHEADQGDLGWLKWDGFMDIWRVKWRKPWGSQKGFTYDLNGSDG